MTDVILIDREGNQIHKYIDDDHPAVVVIRQGGTMYVKRLNVDVESIVSTVVP